MSNAQAQATTTTTAVSIRELMEVGAHFGHQTAKWNPKMKKYIHTSRNGVYIINLQQTVGFFKTALETARRVGASGQKVLFVGTKRQAQDAIREEAIRAGQPYVNERWIGGCLTNFPTIKRSINLMKQLEKMEEEKNYGIRKKKEILLLTKKLAKLQLYYTGIKDMNEVPGAIFVIDPHREYIAINEARVLNIPIIATLDTNCDPEKVDFPIPGNDDSMRAIRLYASKIADAVLEGAATRRSNLENISTAPKAATADRGKVKVEEVKSPVVVKATEEPTAEASAATTTTEGDKK